MAIALGRSTSAFFQQYCARPLAWLSFPLVLVASLSNLSAFAQPIVIGQTYVQTGPLSSLSEQPLIGIRAKISEVNAAGGVNGRPIDLRQLDDGSDTAAAADNVKKLVANGAVAILMPIGTVSSVGALRAANELKVPLVGPYTGAASAVGFSGYGFNVRISYDEEFERIVKHLFTLGIKSIGFVHNDNPGAFQAMEGAKRAIESRGAKMTGSVAIKNDASDADVQAAALLKLSPAAIGMSATNPVAAKFIQAYKKAGGNATFYSSSLTNGQLLFKSIGKDAVGFVVSQVVPHPWSLTSSLVGQYQAAMKKIGVDQLSYASLEGYISTVILVEALKRAGSNPTPQTIKKALESFNPLDLGGLYVKYSPTNHNGLTFSELSMVRADGSYLK